jgi:hypothetical protein
LGSLVLEEVKDARLGRDRLGAQRLFQIRFQLTLAVVFLESADARQDAVPKGHALLTARFHLDLRGNDEQTPTESPTPL